MFSKLHERFGTAGLTVAILALVVALTGTAFAAGSLTSTQKKEVKKIAKQFAGKNGAPGAQGPAGQQGAAGSTGKNGSDGKNGESVTASDVATGVATECSKLGGSKFTVGATTTFACNGKQGKQGEPWSAVLPSEETETGVWSTPVEGNLSEGASKSYVTFNFPVPLETEIPGTNLHFINPSGKEVIFNGGFQEVTSTTCTGTTEAPTAAPGHLCIYAGVQQEAVAADITFRNPVTGISNFSKTSPTARTGEILEFFTPAESFALAMGTWAVTAP